MSLLTRIFLFTLLIQLACAEKDLKRENNPPRKVREIVSYAECGYCNKKVEHGKAELKDWQMQHLHISEDELDTLQFLTCDECKKLSPMKYVEHIEKTVRERMI